MLQTLGVLGPEGADSQYGQTAILLRLGLSLD